MKTRMCVCALQVSAQKPSSEYSDIAAVKAQIACPAVAGTLRPQDENVRSFPRQPYFLVRPRGIDVDALGVRKLEPALREEWYHRVGKGCYLQAITARTTSISSCCTEWVATTGHGMQTQRPMPKRNGTIGRVLGDLPSPRGRRGPRGITASRASPLTMQCP